MNTDSMIYWQTNVKNEDSFEDFFKTFRINSDEDEIKDCVRDLIDNTEEIIEDSNDNKGEFVIKMKGFRHKSIDQLKEDIKDAHAKLCMIDGTDFKISIQGRTRDMYLPKKLYGGANPNIDDWFDLNGLMAKDQINQIIDISIYVWNPETHLERNIGHN